jgi:hypothetical protein
MNGKLSPYHKTRIDRIIDRLANHNAYGTDARSDWKEIMRISDALYLMGDGRFYGPHVAYILTSVRERGILPPSYYLNQLTARLEEGYNDVAQSD